MLSSGFCEHCTYVVHRYACRQNTHTYKIDTIIFFLKKNNILHSLAKRSHPNLYNNVLERYLCICIHKINIFPFKGIYLQTVSLYSMRNSIIYSGSSFLFCLILAMADLVLIIFLLSWSQCWECSYLSPQKAIVFDY